jgi:opacity protein-like surface antigen
MKKLIASLAFAAVCTTSAAAFADDFGPSPFSRVYIEARGGVPFANDQTVEIFQGGPQTDYEPDSGFAIAAAVGTYVLPATRLEYEFWYVEVSDGDMNSLFPGQSISGETMVYGHMLNLLHEFHVDPSFTPYIGAGVGAAIYDTDTTLFGVNADDSDVTFAAAVHAGIDVPLTDMFTFTTRYSIALTTDAEYSIAGGGTITKLTDFTHLLTAGFRLDLTGLMAR